MSPQERVLAVALAVSFLCVLWVSPGHPASVELVPSPASDYRWRDIATNLYSASYQASYAYDDAAATVDFTQCADSAFAGHLAASSLKPNFAYQMKLVGKPEGIWGVAGDDLANERIGYAGRWWRVQPDPGNSNDQDYELHKDDTGYIYEGYLVFDFFVTDSLGGAAVDFASESSYHVLWWEHQRTRGTCDSPVEWSTVIGHAADPGYDEDVGPTVIGVYGEIERLCCGETILPAGTYNCRFALTEESFHQSGEGEGNWATVLVCDTLHFGIDCGAGVAADESRQGLWARPICPNPLRNESSLRFALREAGEVSFAVHSVSGRLVRALNTGVLPAGRHVLVWDGTDGRRRRVAEGVYFYSLNVGDKPGITGKVVVARPD